MIVPLGGEIARECQVKRDMRGKWNFGLRTGGSGSSEDFSIS
jgi:hypothetical protein